MGESDKVKMSSISDRGDSEENIPLLQEINGKESCSSFKTTDDDVAADLVSDPSSGTSFNKSLLLNLAFGNKTVSDENKASNNEFFDTSTKPDEVKERDKDELLAPSGTDEDTDGILSVDSKQKEAAPQEEESAGVEETKVVTVISKSLVSAKILDTAGSGESKLSSSTEGEVKANIEACCPDPCPIAEQAIGDTLLQGQVKVENPVTAGGESVVKLPSPPQQSTTVSPVLTILKPKAQSVHGDEDVYSVQSESIPTDNRSPSFFITNIVSGRIDLGDNAEVIDDLLYWRNPKKTALIFVSVLSVLISMRYYSVISVMAYVSLGCLSVGFIGKLYSTSHGTPNPILQLTPALSEENVRKFTDITAYYVNDTILAIRRLYLADDLADSIKFGLVLWYLTYVGMWFNGMTIVTICFVTVFTLPNIYEYNKEAIDEKITACWDKWLNLTNMARTASQESLKRILSNERHEKVN